MKNKIIMGLLSILLLAFNILLLYLFMDNKNSIFITLGYLLLVFILFRVLIFLGQKLLVKLKVLKYASDDFHYYDKIEQDIRMKANIKHKMQKDRLYSSILYNILLFVLVFLVVKLNNDEGIVSCIFVGILLSLPSLIFITRLNEWDGHGKLGGESDSSSYQATKRKRKIRATTWDFGGYKETTYRDEDGNKIGRATTFDWGPVRDTTFKDKDGNETKVEHWKF